MPAPKVVSVLQQPPAVSQVAAPRPARPVAAPMRPRRPTMEPVARISIAAAVLQHEITTPAPILNTAAQRGGLNMELPGEDSSSRLDAIARRAKWRHIRRRAYQATAFAMVLLITFGGLLFSQSYLKLHKVFKGGTETAAALKTNVNPNLLKGEGAGRVNILLLGRGGGSHDAPDLTDTMMLLSIDPINHTSTLLSIPRDLWVTVPGGGPMKINGAWETGEFKYLGKTRTGSTDPKAIQAGFDSVDQVINGVLGVTVHYNMIVDFKAFQQAVDTVGGVGVNVPADLVDQTMAWENNNNPVLAHAGAQVFDGTQALRYVRSRETSSDFARSQRQRAVMVALKAKVETLGILSNPLKISGLLSSFGDNVSTDLSIKDASRLYSLLKDVSDANITSAGIGDEQNKLITTTNVNNQSVVQPLAGQFNYAGIQQYTRSQLKDPYIKRENAKVIVLNGSSIPGLATARSDELKSYGYNVVATANTPNTGWTQTTLVDLTHNKKYTKHYLEQRLGVTASKALQDQTIPTNGADFVIIIGSNEATSTQTQTH